jgi:hypothetical protein
MGSGGIAPPFLTSRLGGSQSGSGCCGCCTCQVLNPNFSAIQPVARTYTECAISITENAGFRDLSISRSRHYNRYLTSDGWNISLYGGRSPNMYKGIDSFCPHLQPNVNLVTDGETGIKCHPTINGSPAVVVPS